MKQTTKNSINASDNFLSTDQFSTNSALFWSLTLIRLVGYGMIIFSIFDIIDTIVPPRFMNPTWEFQSFGALVERVPLSLLGFAMALVGKDLGRNRIERVVMRFLPWLALIFALMYLLMIPLGIFNTTRLYKQNSRQLVQIEEQIAKVGQLQTNLKQAKTQPALEGILKELGNQNPLPNLQSSQLEELKKQVATTVDGGAKNLKAQADAVKDTQLGLMKKSVKWNLASLISGVLFVIMWQSQRRTKRR